MAVGDDVDLHTLDAVPENGWDLMEALMALPGVGPTIASKLFARKRPRLRPIYDSVVEEYLGADKNQWDPMRVVLRGQPALVKTLEEVRANAKLPLGGIPLLRVLDVICWWEGKGYELDKVEGSQSDKLASLAH